MGSSTELEVPVTQLGAKIHPSSKVSVPIADRSRPWYYLTRTLGQSYPPPGLLITLHLSSFFSFSPLFLFFPQTNHSVLNLSSISPLPPRRSTLFPWSGPLVPSLAFFVPLPFKMSPSATIPEPHTLEKKPIKFSNLLLGAGLNLFEVTTLGQPLEVVKTTMAAHRGDGMAGALGRIWARGGPLGCKLSFPVPSLQIKRSLGSSAL